MQSHNKIKTHVIKWLQCFGQSFSMRPIFKSFESSFSHERQSHANSLHKIHSLCNRNPDFECYPFCWWILDLYKPPTESPDNDCKHSITFLQNPSAINFILIIHTINHSIDFYKAIIQKPLVYRHMKNFVNASGLISKQHSNIQIWPTSQKPQQNSNPNFTKHKRTNAHPMKMDHWFWIFSLFLFKFVDECFPFEFFGSNIIFNLAA